MDAFKGKTISKKEIESLYPAKPDVICDPSDTSGMFLEIRTCWSKDSVPLDCAPSTAGTFGYPCPEYVTFRKDNVQNSSDDNRYLLAVYIVSSIFIAVGVVYGVLSLRTPKKTADEDPDSGTHSEHNTPLLSHGAQ